MSAVAFTLCEIGNTDLVLVKEWLALTPSSIQGLLLVLYSRITPGDDQGSNLSQPGARPSMLHYLSSNTDGSFSRFTLTLWRSLDEVA